MSTTLLFRAPNKAIGGIEIDAFLSENYDFTSQATSHPVESGQDVTDHIRNNPDEISIVGIIGSNYEEPVPGTNRALEIYEQLLELHRNETPVDVVTGLQVFDSMALIALNIDRNQSNAAGLSFTAKFRKVRLVASERVRVAAGFGSTTIAPDMGQTAEGGIKNAATSQQNAGRIVPDTAVSPADTEKASILFNLLG